MLYFNLLTNFADVDTISISLDLRDSSSKYFEGSIWDPYCVGALVLVIMFAYMANYCRVKSLFLLPPLKVIPFNYVGIILSLAIDVAFFGHQTNFL